MFHHISKRRDLLRLLSDQSKRSTIRCAVMSRLLSTVADLPFDLQDKTLFQTGALIGNEWITRADSGKTYNVCSVYSGLEFSFVRAPDQQGHIVRFDLY